MQSEVDSVEVKSIFDDLPLSKIIPMIILIVVGMIAIRYLMKGIRKLLLKSRLDKAIVQMVCTLVKFLLWILLVFVVAGTMGINMNAVIVIISVVALAVSLAVQGVLGNMAGGAQVISAHPFTVGDFVRIGDKTGIVEKIGMVYTLLVTPDNCEIHIPNSRTCTSEIINYTARDTRRVDLRIGLSYNTNPAKAMEALLELARKTPGVLETPAPAAHVDEYQESSVRYLVRVWVQKQDYRKVQYALNEGLWEALRKKGISIPYPQMDVHLNMPGEAWTDEEEEQA